MNNEPYFKKYSRLKIPQNVIIRLLKERHAKGLPVSFEKMQKGNSRLYKAVIHYWGGWINCLRAIGLPTDYHRRWTKELVLEAFKERIRNGKPISPAPLLKEYPGLYFQMRKHFGNKEKLFKTLGIEPKQPLEKNEILERLKKQATKPLGLTNPELRKIKIYSRMMRLFGSKRNALKAMGSTDEEIRGKYNHRKNFKWTAENVRAAIYYLKRNQEDITGGNISRTDESLYRAGIHYFGSWAKALDATGIKCDHPRAAKRHFKWNREKVLKKIQELQEKHGRDNIPMEKKLILYRPSRAFFGSWKRALSAASTNN